MLRKYSTSRTLSENIRLGILTAFSAGMVNVAALIIFFSFASNVTGHYAILAAEIAKGNWYQVLVVFIWIFMFFFGSFTSNFIVINYNKVSPYIAHATPIVLEIICLMAVGIYGQFFYRETLVETEALLALMLFAMGLQNGLTASISNGAVKTTHLTGATTDLGILASMLLRSEYRRNEEMVGKAKLISLIAVFYVAGAVISGFVYFRIGFQLFYLVSAFLVVVILYDAYEIRFRKFLAHEHNKRKSSVFAVSANSNTDDSES
ncbi:MAG: DUF1275 domain-containing protein [Cryomorphaceae bacterium]|nr:MAG: DUF1275 domain-containing protein [Cryomorphaceae bacterium]